MAYPRARMEHRKHEHRSGCQAAGQGIMNPVKHQLPSWLLKTFDVGCCRTSIPINLRDAQIGRILLVANLSKRQHLDQRTISSYLPVSLAHPFGSEQLGTGQYWLSVCDCKQHERSEYQRDGLLVLWVDRFESHRHR